MKIRIERQALNLQTEAPKRNLLKNLEFLLKRFGHDLLGIFLISLAVISTLSKFKITEGKFLDQWVGFIDVWFGWGSNLLIVILAVLGIFILLRRFETFPRMDLERVIFIELAFFSICAALSALGGFSVETASEGGFGGIVGWGLARVFRNIIGEFPTQILSLFFALVFVYKAVDRRNHLGDYLNKYFEEVLTGNKHPRSMDEESPGSYGDQVQRGGVDQKLGIQKTEKQIGEKSLPPLSILLDKSTTLSDEPYIHSKAIQIEKTLEEFGIPARVAGYRVGPTIIQYAVEPGFIEKINDEGNISKKKVRVSQIVGLRKDIALALSVDRLRIEAPIPGHAFVGIEIPNQNSTLVRIKSVLESEEFKRQRSSLSLALGLDVSGNPVVADLEKMPHLLIAGTTGSGKSVCITSIITCIAMNNHPEDLRLSILDPKMVELVRFNGLPHLMGKVETQLDRMLAVLAWAIKEMEDRYKKLEEVNARDLKSYNQKMRQQGGESLPKIVIVIDELADLMLNETEKTESYLVRLAQMARATGIHLVVATQRPSTDIITGLIKANFPARISFMMASSVDSRVILDTNGAETLMGKGDMLYLDPESARLKRAQSVLVDDREIEGMINYWQSQEIDVGDRFNIPPWESMVDAQSSSSDGLLEEAIELVKKDGYASTSRLQRKLRIGFPRAARLIDELEDIGIVGPQESGGRVREVLIDDSDTLDGEEFLDD